MDRKVTLSKERREFIHKDSKIPQDLPFDIRKPKKEPKRDIVFECPTCGNKMLVGKFTYMIECSSCKNLIKLRSYK